VSSSLTEEFETDELPHLGLLRVAMILEGDAREIATTWSRHGYDWGIVVWGRI